MSHEPEHLETLPILDRIKAGEPVNVLVGEGVGAVLLVLTEPAQEWLRAALLRLTQPTPPQANAAAAHRSAQSKGPVSEAEPKLKDGTNI